MYVKVLGSEFSIHKFRPIIHGHFQKSYFATFQIERLEELSHDKYQRCHGAHEMLDPYNKLLTATSSHSECVLYDHLETKNGVIVLYERVLGTIIKPLGLGC